MPLVSLTPELLPMFGDVHMIQPMGFPSGSAIVRLSDVVCRETFVAPSAIDKLENVGGLLTDADGVVNP